MSAGYVYLIRSGDSDRYKIGKTSRPPEKRLAEMDTGAAEHLWIVRTLQSDKYHQIESWLHERFSIYSAKGEWFEFSADVLHKVHLSFIEAEFGLPQRNAIETDRANARIDEHINGYDRKIEEMEAKIQRLAKVIIKMNNPDFYLYGEEPVLLDKFTKFESDLFGGPIYTE